MKFKRIITISLIVAWVGIGAILIGGFFSHPSASTSILPSSVGGQAPSVDNTASTESTLSGQPSSTPQPNTGSTSTTGAKPAGGTTAQATGSGSTGGGPNSTGSGSGSTGGGSTSTPAPQISSFGASPASIGYNTSSTLSWASSNATSCSISPSIGTVAASGSRTTGNLTSGVTYTLTCTGTGSATRQAQVSVGAPPAGCGQSGGACTTAQVATHNSASNCWVIYNNSYYIVTSYVSQHNGGSSVFNSATCGHDITGYLNGSASTAGKQHTHSSSSYTILNSYKVGPVQ